MADIRLVKPQANAVHNVPCATGNRFVLDFPSDAALFAKDGDDLVLSFEDGSSIRLQDFYTTYSKEEMPSFEMEGAEISGEDFFAALGNPDLMPAAGPSAAAATRGGGFNQYGNVELLQGIDRLGGLDISFNWGQEHEDDLYAYGHRDIDYGVSVVPVVPGILDPNIPVVDDPDNPNDGGTGPVVDKLEVWEAGLEDGGSKAGDDSAPTVAHGGMNISAPDGVATIVIGEVTVFANGHLVRGSDGAPVKVETGEGYLQVTGFNPATGRLEYAYTLTTATQEHELSSEHDDEIAHKLTVTVTDSDGDRGSSTIAVVIRDDEPTANNDNNAVTEKESTDVSCSGNVLYGTVDTGEGSSTNPDVIGADGHMNDASKVSWKTDGLVFQGENTYRTEYGTITLYPDGTYTYTLDGNNEAVRVLEKGQSLTETIHYTITDADGDTSSATLTITINGSRHTIDAEVSEKPLVVYEAGLADGSEPGVSGVPTTAQASMTITAHDGLDTVTIDGIQVIQDGKVVEGATVPDIDANGVTVGTLKVVSLVDNKNGTWELKYEYTLSDATQEHADAAEVEGGHNSLKAPHEFAVVITDQGKDSVTHNAGSIKVNIVDDVADARDDRNSVKEGDPSDDVQVATSGNVIKGVRGDDPNDQSGKDTVGADGASVTYIAAGSEGSAETGTPVPAQGTVQIVGKYGTLTIKSDGSYTYTLDETNREVMAQTGNEDEPLSDVFTYTLTDADRDSSKATLTITITGTNHDVTIDNVSALVVDEADLEAENGNAPGVPEAGTTAEGSMLITARDGLASLTITSSNGTPKEVAVVVDEDGRVTGIENADRKFWDGDEETGTGYLTIDSIEDHGNGTYTVHYTYHLENSTQEHDQPADGADRNTLQDGGVDKRHTFTIAAKDQDADKSEQAATIKVDIYDDIPVVTKADPTLTAIASVKEAELSQSGQSSASATINLEEAFKDTVSVGADGLGSVSYELKLSGESVETNLRGLAGEGENAKYENIVLVKVDGAILGVTDSNNTNTACFRIEVNPETGELSFTLLKPLEHLENDVPTDTLVLETVEGSLAAIYTVTDKDGDSVSVSLDLGNSGAFTIVDDESTVNGKTADLAVDESFAARPNDADSDRHVSDQDKGEAVGTTTSLNAYDLFEIDLGADDQGLNVTQVEHTFSLSIQGTSGEDGLYASGLQAIYTDAEGERQTGDVLLELDENGTTITGTVAGQSVFTVTIDESGNLQFTLGMAEGVSIVNLDRSKYDEAAVLNDKIQVKLQITDRDGDIRSDTANVTLKFEDDGPALELPAAEAITSTALKDGTGTLSGQMTFDFGADGAAFGEGVQAMVVTVTDNGKDYIFNCVQQDDGTWKGTSEDGDHSFTVGTDKQFAYTRPLSKGTDSDVTIKVTLTDGDGDTITATTTEYAPVVTTTDSGDLQEAGVAGCTMPNDPNDDVPGTSVASGTITLAQSEDGSADSDTLQLTGWSGTITHTKLTDSHEDPSDATAPGKPQAIGQNILGETLGESLTLYLVQDTNGSPVLVDQITEDTDYYGTLTFEKKTDSKWDWKFKLNEGDTLVNNMTEQETIEIDFNFKVSDGMLQGDGDLKITIKGTNDKPLFTADTSNNLQELRDEHAIVVSSNENEEFEDTFTATNEQKLQATDPDSDNGAGEEAHDTNHLVFSVAGMKGWTAGRVTGEGAEAEYREYDNTSDKNNLESIAGNVDPHEDGSTSIETTYGILTVYRDGSYKYEAKDTNKIGADEYVTETFVIRVTDAHGSYSEETIVITLRDKDHSIENGNDITLVSKEAGVAGNDDEFHLSNDEHKYNDPVTAQNGASKDFLFKDVDVNDTLTIKPQANADNTINIDGTKGDISSFPSITLDSSGKASCSLVVSQDDEGKWTFAWTTEPAEGADVVGTLVFTRGDDGSVNPSFNLNSESGFLDQLHQEESLSIELPLSATSDGDSSKKSVESTLTINIEGTNDQPTITTIVIDGNNTDKADITAVIYPGEDSQESEPVTLRGNVMASDVDNDNPQGEGLIYTLEKVTSTTDGHEEIPASHFESGTAYPGTGDDALPSDFAPQYTTIETTYGTLTITPETGEFTYTLKDPEFLEDGTPNAIMALGKGQSVTETFTIRVTDEHGSWTEKPITITINGTNDAPVLTIDNLEVHATEDNIPDREIHEDKEDHSSVTVTAEDYDYGHELTYWFHNSDPEIKDMQSVTITVGQLLAAIEKNELEYKGEGASWQVLQALLKGMKTTDPIATLKLSETGELTLEANQDSAFIQALNDGDNLTFNLSDIAPGLQVVARDEHGAYSNGEDVTLVLHGNDDDYTPVSVVVPHVKEEGVYRNEGDLVTDTTGAGEGQNFEQPGYGQHQLSNSGKFTINDRDAGQITFSHGDQNQKWKETGTTLNGKEIPFDEGTEPAGPMYVLGEYGYYVIDLSSTMDANGTKTFEYTYYLYSDEGTPKDVEEMVNEAFADSNPAGWKGRLDAVDSIAQGEQVSDSVTISVSTDNGNTYKDLTLESIVSGSNDSPEITGVAMVNNPEEGTALQVSENKTSEANTMYLVESGDNQTLHITLQAPESGETSHFVGKIVGVDPDKDTEDGSHDDGTQVVNYAFVNTGEGDNSSHNVWSISEDGESASSEYGYITIDADGVFHIHLYEDAAKALGEGELSEEDIFEGLGVRCIDDLGATSNIVHLSGHLVGVDDQATAIDSREDLWEGVHEHDTSIPAQDPAPHDKPLAEKNGVVEGKVVVTDPDSSDTFLRIVTVTVAGEERTLVFDEDGMLISVDGDTNASVVDTARGTFSFTLKIDENEAVLEYSYTVNDLGLDAIDKLEDGEILNFEQITVSFTSVKKDGETPANATSSATISIDVHGTNDAPVIQSVETASGQTTPIADDTIVNGGTLDPKEQTSGKITATDPDEGETSELTYGILIYTDEENNEHIVYGQTGEDGRTKYFAADGSELPEDINLDSLTFTNHADLEHGSIYVDDDGNYTYSRYPKDGEEGSETVYITVRDPDGAMDHVEIEFELKPGDGGRLPDVTMKGDISLEVIEPSDKGDRVHVGDEDSSASSFTEGIVEKLSITVSYYQDKDGYHLLDKDENGNWVHLDGTSIPDGLEPSTATGKLVPTENGSYKWEYTDKNGETLEDFTVPLDIRLTPEGEEYGWDDGTYSLQTDYGTVYVDRVTGELRFELDSRADTLNAGEVHSENVVIWINGNPQDVSLDVTVTGTADASEVETEALSVDLEDASEDATVEATGTLTIDDIDNDAGAEDRHTLAIEVTGEDGEPKHLDVVDGTTIYVMAEEDGLVYTDVKPEGDNWNSCYGELSFSQNKDGSYDYTFKAYSDSTVSKEIQDNDHLDLRVPVLVTDIAPDADSYPEGGFDAEHYKETKTEAEIAITVTGKADAPDVTNSTLDITEEGARPEEQGDGSHSVTGTLTVVDYDDSGVTVTGIEGELEEGQAFENGSTVVPGKYGTLVLHNDGTYTYTVNYDEVQYLAQGESVPDVFTVAVGNKGGQSLATITVNVYGTNDVPTVTVTPVLTVQEQHEVADITVSGRVEAQDIDKTDTLSYGFSTGEDSGELVTTLYVVGKWVGDKLELSTSAAEPTDASSLVGTLTMGEYGEYTFTLEDSEATRGLPHGESAEIVVQAGASDSHAIVTKPVTITIRGSNEAPEVTTNITIGEDDLVGSSSVQILPSEAGYTATDADRGTTLSYTFSRDGEYRTTETGTITIDGIPYQVGLVIDTVTGAITISYEDSALQELINALGKNDEPLEIDTEGLQVVVQDGEGGRTSSELTLTIQGANDAPVIESATMNNNEGSLTFSDVDKSDKHTISVLVGGTRYEMNADSNEVVVDGLGTFTFERTENGWDYSFVADSETASAIPSGKEEPYSFKLQVSDGTESDTTTQNLSVTVTGTGQTVEDLDTTLADDMSLFANAPDDVLDTLASLSNTLDDTVDTASIFEDKEESSLQPQELEDMDSPFENALRLLEDPNSEEAEPLFARNTYSLADGEEMYSLSPDEPEENTVDIVAYDSTDYMVDGGEGVSFMVSENEDLTMDDILQGDGQHGPIVSNIDVLITGEGAESLTNMEQLARDYGISVDRDANSLTLDESWQKVDSGHTDTQVFSNGSLTLETSLDVSRPSDDLNVQAAMHQVTNN